MFHQANRSQSPAHPHSPFAERSASRTPLGKDEIATGARWKRFLLALATGSGLETERPGGTFPRGRRGNHD